MRSAFLVSAISLFVEASKKSISVPIKRSGFSTPITATQKLYNDFHRQRIENDPELENTKKEAGGEVPIILKNLQNTCYTGPILFGTPLAGSTDSEFVFDTGSAWLAVTSEECSGCSKKYYDAEASSTSYVLQNVT